jgi:hypothetical protein
MLAALPFPDVTYRGGLTLWPGAREAVIRTPQGHTGGDSIVFLPAADVVFAGDLFWKDTLPNLIDANTKDGSHPGRFLAEHPASRLRPGTARSGRRWTSLLPRLPRRPAQQRGKGDREGNRTGPDRSVLPCSEAFASGLVRPVRRKNIEQTEQEPAAPKVRSDPLDP